MIKRFPQRDNQESHDRASKYYYSTIVSLDSLSRSGIKAKVLLYLLLYYYRGIILSLCSTLNKEKRKKKQILFIQPFPYMLHD